LREAEGYFVNGSIWQLTKRRWAIAATEPYFYIAFAITVLAFAALGPFGTFSEMPITERIGFWFLVHLVAWAMAVLIIVPIRFTMEYFGMAVLPAFIVGSFCANIAIAPIFIWFLAESTDAALTTTLSIGLFFVIAGVISLITFTVLRLTGIEVIPANFRSRREWSHEVEAAMAPIRNSVSQASGCAMMPKLPAEKRGTLLAMIAHDHYVEVVTDKGRHLVLMRLSDAAELCGPCDGMRVHRSAWVARAGMSELIVKGRRMWICLPDGSMVTVSRQYQDDVRDFRTAPSSDAVLSGRGTAAAGLKPQ